jgi:O-antigen/teichoic acid export membrane protein
MRFTRTARRQAPGAMWHAVVRNLGWLLASRGVVAILSLVYLGIATRTLGLVGFGRFALITSAAQALTTLVAFQSWQMIVQFGVDAAQADDSARLGRLFRGSAGLDALGALVGTVLAIVILETWSGALGIGETLKRAALVYTIIQVVTIRSTALGILRLRDRFALAAMADSTNPIVRLVGAVLVMFLHPTLQGFLVVWAVAEVVTAATYWGMVAWTGDLNLLVRARGFRRMLQENPNYMNFAISTNASATLSIASKQLPLLVIGSELGVAAAGTFRLAAQLAQALGKLGQLLSRAAFPEVVRALRASEDVVVRSLLLRTVIVSATVGAVIMMLAITIGSSVLILVGGREFEGGAAVLVWMAAVGAVDLVAVGLDTVLTARGDAARILFIRIAGVGATLAVAFVALPALGETGMALGLLAGSLVVTGSLFRASGRARTVPHG